ncbi:biofilm development regulator YmgB/AriR family protein [Pantoea vagans]|uniref:biofilm development regulator YmgB/AriR family protein n=1 Tax=Pantoea vagans TaxID=470934 RepID=UPI0022511181|nr:biofilm development regulator YmgB/AriR family protein [Pantoea vagans]MCX3311006.1 biofilm development regulator YmgB/AriR family protein [Pantoea vagans]
MHQTHNSDDSGLIYALDNIDDIYEDEKIIFSAAIRTLLNGSGSVTSRELLFYLIAEMETTTDIVRLDVLRTCLEILMGLKNPARAL